MPRASSDLLTDLLKETSRSFHLTLRILPRAVRPQIGLAYLLARTTDTIADTELVPLAARLEALEDLRSRIAGERTAHVRLEPLLEHQNDSAERDLLLHNEKIIARLDRFQPDDRHRIREVLRIITSGQELDLQRFSRASAESIVALQSEEELDQYTYRVAGCVGEFWTRICRAHLFPRATLDEAKLLADGVRFGKGLQLVNILRDLPRDLRQGRCYLPAPALTEAGLQPADLLSAQSEPRFRACYDRYLDKAGAHLAAGWDYTNALPFRGVRVRLACSWPILIGIRTLALLRTANVLDASQRVKVSRAEVKSIILGTLWRYPFRDAWQFSPARPAERAVGRA
jgi:farnesyl-diphosphate farnesyltransferase